MEAELERVSPEFVVCLGATAAKAVFGAQFRLTEQRGRFIESRFAEKTLATYHPSAVLRADSQAAQDELYRILVEDLKAVTQETAKSARGEAERAAVEQAEADAARLAVMEDAQREANQFRAQGAEDAQKIRSEADKERTILLAEAKRLIMIGEPVD